MKTATQMLAEADGIQVRYGQQYCFYCGGRCSEHVRSGEHVKNTFTGRNTVARPSSGFVCDGCVHAMTNGYPVAGYEKPQKLWQYSHIVTERHVVRVRGDQAALIDAIAHPPTPPYVISVAVSLKKHLLYRCPVNLDRSIVRVQLEENVITTTPELFQARLDVCRTVAAACGKPALLESNPHRLAISLSEYYAEWEAIFLAWTRISGEPLTGLCAQLCEKKEICRGKHQSTRSEETRYGVLAPNAGRIAGPGLFD